MSPEATGTPSGLGLHGGELLLRRFNPEDYRHYDIDQERPDDGPVLRPPFLRFDRHPKGDALPAEYFGCSVFRDQTLRALGVARTDVLHDEYIGLATITAEDVRATGRFSHPNPVDAIADPITPEASDGSDTYNAAHALITLSPKLKRSQRDKLQTKICRRMSILWLRP